MWTVIGSLNNDEQVKSETEGTHAFLILSQEDSTMVQQYMLPLICQLIWLLQELLQIFFN